MDYDAIAAAGGFPKVGFRKSAPDKPKGLKQRTPLKSNSHPIPLDLKKKVIEAKGDLCLLGFCPNCGGQARVTEHDDGHHWPHRGKGGKDCVEHIWIMKHDCHMFLHDNPLIEKQVFGEILAKANEVLKKVTSHETPRKEIPKRAKAGQSKTRKKAGRKSTRVRKPILQSG